MNYFYGMFFQKFNDFYVKINPEMIKYKKKIDENEVEIIKRLKNTMKV